MATEDGKRMCRVKKKEEDARSMDTGSEDESGEKEEWVAGRWKGGEWRERERVAADGEGGETSEQEMSRGGTQEG